MPEEPTAQPAPATLRTALLLLGVETVLLGLLTLFLVYADFTAESTTVSTAIGTTVFAALFTGLLGWFTWSLYRRRAWARGPAVVLQLLLIPTGVTMLTGGLPVLGVPTVLVGLVGAATLMAPTTRGALGRK
jgi:hypothetical protein